MHVPLVFLFGGLRDRPSVSQKLNPDAQWQLAMADVGSSRVRRGGGAAGAARGVFVDAVPDARVFEIFRGCSLVQGSVRLRDAAAEAVAGRVLVVVSQEAGVEQASSAAPVPGIHHSSFD